MSADNGALNTSCVHYSLLYNLAVLMHYSDAFRRRPSTIHGVTEDESAYIALLYAIFVTICTFVLLRWAFCDGWIKESFCTNLVTQ